MSDASPQGSWLGLAVAVAWLLNTIINYRMRKSPNIEANSIGELVGNGIKKLTGSNQGKTSMTPVETVSVSSNVVKETKDVVDLAAGVIEAVKAGKTVAEIAASELPALMAAFEGFQNIPAEIASANKADLAGYIVSRNMKALGIE